MCDFNISSTNLDPIQTPTSPSSAPTTIISNGGIGKSGKSCKMAEQNLSKTCAGAKAPQTHNMLPTDTTILGDFLNANDHYANHVNQFGLHTPDACRHYAAGMLLRTPGAHEQFSSSKFVCGLSTININPSNIHTWAILDSGATSHCLVTMAPKSSVSPINDPLHVSLPNGDQVQSTHTYTLALPQLPVKARF